MQPTELVTLNMRELDRLKVIQAVVDRMLKPGLAAERLHLTVRQIEPLVLRYKQTGAAGVGSAARGRPGNRKLDEVTACRALILIRDRYADFGPTLACEKLRECHGLTLSKETVRHLMTDAGLWVPRKQRAPKIHQPRNRRSCLGELIQIDGSDHRWFEDRAPACTLLVFIDDLEKYAITITENKKAVAVGNTVQVEFGDPRPGIGLLADDVAGILKAPRNRLNEPKNYFVLDCKYAKTDAEPPAEVQRYRRILKLIGLLETVAAYLDKDAGKLVFVHGGRFALKAVGVVLAIGFVLAHVVYVTLTSPETGPHKTAQKAAVAQKGEKAAAVTASGPRAISPPVSATVPASAAAPSASATSFPASAEPASSDGAAAASSAPASTN